MMSASATAPVRLGAVAYLNTKPLVFGLEARPDLFSVRYDVPSQCAVLLHAGDVDLGLIPAIEYLSGDYRIVPGVGIVSDGPVDSVAVFSRVPVDEIATLALDTSSRTSVALTRILCQRRWNIAPAFVPAEPDIDAMLARADAALIIGDLALEIDARARGVLKLDLGAEWRLMTGLPFVYAMWTGREGACGPQHVEALNVARDRGVTSLTAIAETEAPGDPVRQERIVRYLGDNLSYRLGPRELAGMRRFHELAAEVGLVPSARPLRFFQE